MAFTSPSIYEFSHPTFRYSHDESPITKHDVKGVTEHISYHIPKNRKWNIGICNCCASHQESKQSIWICIKGFFCPCILYNQVESRCHFCQCCFCCCFRAGYRRQFRNKYELPEEPCNDCCVICCCPCCSVVQEYNENQTGHLSPKEEIMKM